MGSPEYTTDEPLTPAGRMFMRPELNTIIHCVIGVKNPIDVDAVKSEIASSLMVKHPRFCSLLVRDHRGVEYWRKTEIDINRHFIVINSPVSDKPNINVDDDAAAVNEYLADLSVSSPLSTDKPLWEIHILLAHKCAIIRIHHSLGDGISLMSMFLTSCRKADDPQVPPSIGSRRKTNQREGKGKDWRSVVWEFVRIVWFTTVFMVEFALRCLWVRDRKTAVGGGEDGMELWPRKLATARFRIQDMKVVKQAVTNATINDVLFGVVSSGLSRYLDYRSPSALPEGLQLTGVAMVNLREQPGLQEISEMMKSNSGARWGNKFGILLLPIYYHKSGADPLQYVKRAKAMIDRKKSSLEALLSYKIADFAMTWLGPKVACWLNYRIICNATFTISNVFGPQEEITITGNPVTYIRANTSSVPHALTMHMVSYAERADMQLLVAKDIIPDPELLAKCFEDALLEMKEAAAAITEA